jgi:N-acyl-D-aspartate/D-glutamate deacylase
MMKRLIPIALCYFMAIFLLSSCRGKAPGEGDFDILITNGKILDGTGHPAFSGDVGIKGDTIAEIGNLEGKKAAKIIDAKGFVVSPGFIDMHTHCDDGLGDPESSANLNYLIQGTTTVVTGNCASGTFEIAKTKELWERQGLGTNAIHLVGLGDVRRAVLGVDPREPTPEEIEKMQSIVRKAMEEGAWGVSAGLEYIPNRYASTEEVIALTKIAAEFGGVYSSHQRDECSRVPEATEETIRLAEETGIRVNVAHYKVCGKSNWGMIKEAVDVINQARARGIPITADMYPYEKAATGYLWEVFLIPKDMEPLAGLQKKMEGTSLPAEERQKLGEQYKEELVKALKDKEKREQIKKLTENGYPYDPGPVVMWGWDNLTVMVADKNPDLIGKIISDLAEEQGRESFDIAADIVIDDPDAYQSGGAMSEEEMKYAMKQDWLMFSSDGEAFPVVTEEDRPRNGHPRSFGSQARVLQRYVREEKVLTLEDGIRKMTSLPASFLQLKDRGILKKGYKADIAIFDPETIREHATYADSRRYSTGTEYVIINGKIGIENGRYGGGRHGKWLLLTENK